MSPSPVKVEAAICRLPAKWTVHSILLECPSVLGVLDQLLLTLLAIRILAYHSGQRHVDPRGSQFRCRQPLMRLRGSACLIWTAR
jgi:hypothetical protein